MTEDSWTKDDKTILIPELYF